jgi:hypothetical protein
MLLDEETIRVFASVRDAEGAGRPVFVDVRAEDPTRIIRVAPEPLLEIGRPGCFDDNGIVPSALVRRDGRVFLYYGGYQLATRVRFVAFTGLAISDDGGTTFTKHSDVPILDRAPGETCFRAIYSILSDAGRWRVWYGAGSGFAENGPKPVPEYDIRYLESADGMHFPDRGEQVMDAAGGDEYRLSRPAVLKTSSGFEMFYSVGTFSSGYRLGYARSGDGIHWSRLDHQLGLDVSPEGWDSKMMAFPSVVDHGNNRYLFYNGNDYGREGFGVAKLDRGGES